MEVVNTLDIDGTQWEIQDVKARNDIETIKQSMTPKEMPKIEITLNNGYSATIKEIRDVQKYGKLYMGLLFIDNLSGKNIGTIDIANFGKANINLIADTYAIGIEYLSSSPVRSSITKTGVFQLQESVGVTDGNNHLRIPIIWIEP